MDDHAHEWIDVLEKQWSKPSGFLGKVRVGQFDPVEGSEFLEVLRSIPVPSGKAVDRRLVALLWYLPLFLGWQKERVRENGNNADEFGRLITEVQGVLEELLGVP